ncbi:MAG: sarcosine oxidase subunit gamma family protein [Pseudomonadota bacterium]
MPETAVLGVSAPAGTEGRVIAGEDLRIAEAGPVGQVTLRADLAEPAVAEAVAAVTGCSLPAPLTASFADGNAAVWMATDELLLILPAEAAAGAVSALESALAGHHRLALDVSAARVLFRLSGSLAGEVLAKGAPLDFRDAAFAPGTARRTHLGQIAVGIWRESPSDWSLVCFRSLSAYVADWLAETAAPGRAVRHF